MPLFSTGGTAHVVGSGGFRFVPCMLLGAGGASVETADTIAVDPAVVGVGDVGSLTFLRTSSCPGARAKRCNFNLEGLRVWRGRWRVFNSVLRLLLVDVRLATVEQSEAVAVVRLVMVMAVSCWIQ
jgi:hypothetical protein